MTFGSKEFAFNSQTRTIRLLSFLPGVPWWGGEGEPAHLRMFIFPPFFLELDFFLPICKLVTPLPTETSARKPYPGTVPAVFIRIVSVIMTYSNPVELNLSASVSQQNKLCFSPEII